MKIQWQIKQHKDAKKAQNQHDEEVGKAFSFCEDHKKNKKKDLKWQALGLHDVTSVV